MHASGAIATKLAPFLALIFVADRRRAPAWASPMLLGFGVLLIVTDVFFSTKTSDWKKVRARARGGESAGTIRDRVSSSVGSVSGR